MARLALDCPGCRPASGPVAVIEWVVESQGERDAVTGNVDVKDFYAHDVAWFHHLAEILDEPGRQGGDVDEAIVVDPDVNECAEGGDVGHDPLEDHPGDEVLQLVDALFEGGGLRRRGGGYGPAFPVP